MNEKTDQFLKIIFDCLEKTFHAHVIDMTAVADRTMNKYQTTQVFLKPRT